MEGSGQVNYYTTKNYEFGVGFGMGNKNFDIIIIIFYLYIYGLSSAIFAFHSAGEVLGRCR